MAEYKALTAEQFLKYFEGTIFQTFYDPDSTKKDAPCFTTYNPEELKKLNDQKYGIYFSVNAFRDRRVKENLIKLNAVYGDLDLGKENDGQTPENVLIKKREVFKKLAELPIKPNIITVTKNGLQPLFLIENPGIDKPTQDTYISTVCGLTTWSIGFGCKGDAVKDVSRVLRIPGYYHQKGEPEIIKSFLLHEKKTTLKELAELFPYFDERKIKNDNAAPDGQPSELDKLSMKEIALAAFKEKGEPDAYFDDKGRVWLKRGVTGAFLGKLNNCDYIGSNSHDLPYGNKITFVREFLELPDNKAAFRWIADKFNLSKTQAQTTQSKAVGTTYPPISKNWVFEPIWANELKTQPSISIDWVIEGILARGYISLLGAREKAGKTTLISGMLQALTKGGEFLGQAVTKSRVLVISEEKAGHWNRRIENLGLSDCENLCFVSQPFTSRAKQKAWEEFLIQDVTRFCKEKEIDVLIFDTISPIWPPLDENNASEVQTALLPLVALSKENVAVMPVHHYNKSGGLRGSTVLGAVPDVLLDFGLPPGNEDTTRRLLKIRSRFEESPAQLLLDYKDAEYFLLGTPAQVLKREKLDAIKQTFADFSEGATVQDLLDGWNTELSTKPSRSSLKLYLSELCGIGEIYQIGSKEIKGGKAFVYSLNPVNQDTWLGPKLLAKNEASNPVNRDTGGYIKQGPSKPEIAKPKNYEEVLKNADWLNS